MTQITVTLVKYDTEKTTKRKRSKLLVEAKTEEAVIEKLEKIHKGDKVKTIHEIVWGQEKANDKNLDATLIGTVKFFDEAKEFGFIEPDADMDDVFFHASALNGKMIYAQERVEFETSERPKGLVAIHIKAVDERKDSE